MSAKNNGMELYLESKTVWSVYDDGWFYSFRMKTCDTKEEAIHYWEELTHKSYDQYDEYIKNSYHGDGHWYYDIQEENLAEYFAKREKAAIENAIHEKEKEIQERGNERIEIAATKDERHRIANIMNGLSYYLQRTIGYDDIGLYHDDKSRLFKESLKEYEINP